MEQRPDTVHVWFRLPGYPEQPVTRAVPCRTRDLFQTGAAYTLTPAGNLRRCQQVIPVSGRVALETPVGTYVLELIDGRVQQVHL